MGKQDKVRHQAEEVAGTAKRKVGEATGDTGLRAEGGLQEAKAKAKQAGDEAAERARNVKEDVEERARRSDRDRDR
jgi:uncharacterized protein YjbJ (UPF0337 family)